MKNIKLIEHKKIRICCDDEKQSIELGRESINNGFLKSLPGPSLPVFIYILTHLDNNNTIKTNPALIAGFLPLDRENTIKGLNFLEDNNYIKIDKNRTGNYSHIISVNLNKIDNSCFINNDNDQVNNENLTSYRNKVIDENNFNKEDIKKALLSFLPDKIDHSMLIDEIECWIDDFDKKMLKELIRRTNKWFKKNNKNKKEGFYYLHGIIDDWYNKDIFEYERLKHFDKMYRETNELAKCYGLKNWYNVTETQMEIFHDWLNKNEGINLSIAKYAIKEAFKRKSDGQPSLKYIEDNFIIPLKENKVQNIEQAKNILDNNSYNKNSNENNNKFKTSNKKNNWNTFEWDIEDLN
ncbi:MAG: hypothetical protein U5K53_10200 [Halanaerobiales bacterium]|nr:hypothetical protein [Halanaerobiales bacterium]